MAFLSTYLISYLGIPLVTSGGYVLGPFCVTDSKPSWWGGGRHRHPDLAVAVMAEIRLRTEIAARSRVEGARGDLAGYNAHLSKEITARKQAEEQQYQLEALLYRA